MRLELRHRVLQRLHCRVWRGLLAVRRTLLLGLEPQLQNFHRRLLLALLLRQLRDHHRRVLILLLRCLDLLLEARSLIVDPLCL